jgi:hypothetical protein
VTATIYSFEQAQGPDFLDFFMREIRPALESAGASVLACFETESSPNTFPALPVREGEHVFVFFSRFEDAAAHQRHLSGLARSKSWSAASLSLSRRLSRPPETLRLAPTARSLLGR